MPNILLIGHGAREHVIAERLKDSPQKIRLYSFMKSLNPGIKNLSADTYIGNYDEIDKIKIFARNNKIDFAFIGPEEPLANSVVNELEIIGIKSIGPNGDLARLETSKSFTRGLLEKYKIDVSPKFKIFDSLVGISDFIGELDEYVIKPDGLTGGKGVWVYGDHFNTSHEALRYCEEVIGSHSKVVIEEKLDGEEFSLQSFTDGKSLFHCPVVQDHKRALPDDKGSNTGGMGSYSCDNHLLPFLSKKELISAQEITANVLSAIRKETSAMYKGIMYGGFMLTNDGVRLLEYNARLGDPEAINVLSIFRGDFVELCYSIIEGKLNNYDGYFDKLSTVCKYVVPNGYPDNPVKNQRIEIGHIPENAKMFYASVSARDDGLYMTGSRAIAFLGISERIEDAERISESAISAVKGQVFHRQDIGTSELIKKRIAHINEICNRK